MKGVVKHISELLYHHDCVIVPGMGGLVANPVPATFDESKNMFSPAGKEIGFNKNLTHNDGLLINHIAKSENISYEEAKKRVSDYAETVTRQLKNSKAVSLDSIGELRGDIDGAIIFTPDTTENFLTDSYGLSSFHFTPSVTYQHQGFNTRNSVRRLIRPISTRHIAAAAAIVAGLFMFPPEIKNPGINQASGIEFLTPTKNITSVTTPRNKESLIIGINAGKNKEEYAQPKKIILNYFIITGSFKKIDQADRYCKKLNAKGQINPLILKSPNGRFRVAIEGFSNKKDALASLSVYRSKTGFNSAWLLTQKQ